VAAPAEDEDDDLDFPPIDDGASMEEPSEELALPPEEQDPDAVDRDVIAAGIDLTAASHTLAPDLTAAADMAFAMRDMAAHVQVPDRPRPGLTPPLKRQARSRSETPISRSPSLTQRTSWSTADPTIQHRLQRPRGFR